MIPQRAPLAATTLALLLSGTALLAQDAPQPQAETPAEATPETPFIPAPVPLEPLLPEVPELEEELEDDDLELPPDLQDPQRWSRVCTRAGCTIAARLVSVQEGRLLTSIAMTHDLRGEIPVLAIFTPLGMATRPGVRLLVDETRPIPVEVDVCLPDGCRATLELDRLTFETILAAQALTVQYFAFGRPAPLSFPLSMDGYEDATDHLPDFWAAAAEADAAMRLPAATP